MIAGLSSQVLYEEIEDKLFTMLSIIETSYLSFCVENAFQLKWLKDIWG